MVARGLNSGKAVSPCVQLLFSFGQCNLMCHTSRTRFWAALAVRSMLEMHFVFSLVRFLFDIDILAVYSKQYGISCAIIQGDKCARHLFRQVNTKIQKQASLQQ